MGVAGELRRAGHDVRTPSFASLGDGPGPYWPRCVSTAVAACDGADEVVIIGHSGAGPLLPAIGVAQGRVKQYVFVDATLPIDGYTRAGSFTRAERGSPSWADAALKGEAPNPWRDARLWRRAGVTDAVRAAALAAESPAIPLAMNDEPVTVPAAWPDAPVAYLAFTPNPFYEPAVAEARRRSWAVREIAGAHFHMLIDPAAVARELLCCVSERPVMHRESKDRQ